MVDTTKNLRPRHSHVDAHLPEILAAYGDAGATVPQIHAALIARGVKITPMALGRRMKTVVAERKFVRAWRYSMDSGQPVRAYHYWTRDLARVAAGSNGMSSVEGW